MRWYRLVAGLGVVAVALFTFAGSARAGGWAVTTIDSLPDGGFEAGKTYQLGYTIRQHGQHPFDGAKTAITIASSVTGERHVFPGLPDGPAGHYVAEVTFPSEGTWDWQVSQEPFAAQTLGTIAVAPSAVAPSGDGTTPSWEGPGGQPVPSGAFGLQTDRLPWQSLAAPLALTVGIGLMARHRSGLLRRGRSGG